MADYLVIAGFFAVMLAIGVFFSTRMQSLKDFFCGGNQVPWWVSGISLYMTTFSAFAFVAYSALAYRYGFVAIFIWWSGLPGWLLSARYFAARWRRAAPTSPIEYVEARYGALLRQGFAWEGVPLIIIDDALKLFVIGKMVTVSLGSTSTSALLLAIVVCGGIMLSYTFLGGLWAVMVTDFTQFVIMAAAVVVLAPLVLLQIGGVGALFRETPDGFWNPAAGDYTWAWLIAFFAVQVLNYATKWPLVQRYYAVRTDAEARKVGYLVAALTFIGPPLLFLPGMTARIFMPGIEDANAVYPMVCKQLLPIGMVGMMIAAMFSATMSMLSSDYNAVASVLTNDIYRRIFARNAGDRALVMAGRLSTLFTGVAALTIAVVLAKAEESQDLVQIMAQLFGILVPPVAIPMMFGLLSGRVSNAGALGGFLAGTLLGIVAFAMSYVEGFAYLRTVTFITWITAAPTLAVMLLVSSLFPDNAEKRERVHRFLAGLEDRGRTAGGGMPRDTRNDAGVAIWIIGLATAAMGGILLGAVVLTGAATVSKLSPGVGAALLAAGLAAAAWGRRLGHSHSNSG